MRTGLLLLTIGALLGGCNRPPAETQDASPDTSATTSAAPGAARSVSERRTNDQAYFNNVMPSWVLKDDVFMSFIMPTSNREQTLAGFLAVSKKALERLPQQVPLD